ncbi:MAG: hypothetical protein NC299_13695 [Lachnospiraceae bacterium]|nr:hypothetical protein [Ruminococcus sp.]MCM1276388.1 hypothetical protein [Lachnospiraceae bacterium]
MIRTIDLDGSETIVKELGGQNTAIINKSGSAVYASKYPNIKPEADGVIEIAAGARDGLYGTNGTLYLLGNGKVELRGTDYSVNFNQPSSGNGGGGSAELLPAAAEQLGGVMIGDGISADANGKISVDKSRLAAELIPTAAEITEMLDELLAAAGE